MSSDKNRLEVSFSKIGKSPLPGQVIIYPEEDKWNDFGFHIKCNFSARLSKRQSAVHGGMLIGFLPSEKLSDAEQKEFNGSRISLNDLLGEAKKDILHASDMPFFFTLLPDINSYRRLVKSLAPNGAEEFLRAVNDLVIFKKTKVDWINRALSSEVFVRGFMRDSGPFFAFSNADSVLGGVEEEDFSSISKALTLMFPLDGYENDHEIKFQFSSDSLIPRRINVLIGINGTGKSQALKYFCRSALRYRDSGVHLIDTETEHGRPMISRVLAVATPGETGNTFPPERKNQKLFYRRLNLTRNGRAGTSRSIGETLVQLARSDDEIGSFTRWELFINALEKVLPIDSIQIAKRNGSFLPLRDLSRNGGEQARLDRCASVDETSEPRIQVSDNAYPLSSGQLTFFKFCLLCCRYIENGAFVLMDEPETHLHPNLISEFVGLLDYLLEHTGSQAILATHSAYFVREVPKEQVHVFQELDEGVISIVNPRLRTFGATVDSISQFVFGEDVEIRLTDKIYERVKERSFDSIDEELSQQLSLAALMDLRRRMGSET